jgi:hypothetical protein
VATSKKARVSPKRAHGRHQRRALSDANQTDSTHLGRLVAAPVGSACNPIAWRIRTPGRIVIPWAKGPRDDGRSAIAVRTKRRCIRAPGVQGQRNGIGCPLFMPRAGSGCPLFAGTTKKNGYQALTFIPLAAVNRLLVPDFL